MVSLCNKIEQISTHSKLIKPQKLAMEVKNVEYFHIHTIGEHSSLWKVGNRINWVQKRNNLFYDYYNTNGFLYNDGTGPLPFRQALERFLSGNEQEKQTQALDIIQWSKEVIKSQSMFIREQIFEEVRSSYFPHLPSRKTCIWVCTKDAVEYWLKTLNLHNQKSQKIFKLQLTGSLYSNPK